VRVARSITRAFGPPNAINYAPLDAAMRGDAQGARKGCHFIYREISPAVTNDGRNATCYAMRVFIFREVDTSSYRMNGRINRKTDDPADFSLILHSRSLNENNFHDNPHTRKLTLYR